MRAVAWLLLLGFASKVRGDGALPARACALPDPSLLATQWIAEGPGSPHGPYNLAFTPLSSSGRGGDSYLPVESDVRWTATSTIPVNTLSASHTLEVRLSGLRGQAAPVTDARSFSQVWLTLDAYDPGGVLASVWDTAGPSVVYDAIVFGDDVAPRLGLASFNGTQTIAAYATAVEQRVGQPMHLALAVDSVTGNRTLYRNGVQVARIAGLPAYPFPYAKLAFGCAHGAMCADFGPGVTVPTARISAASLFASAWNASTALCAYDNSMAQGSMAPPPSKATLSNGLLLQPYGLASGGTTHLLAAGSNIFSITNTTLIRAGLVANTSGAFQSLDTPSVMVTLPLPSNAVSKINCAAATASGALLAGWTTYSNGTSLPFALWAYFNGSFATASLISDAFNTSAGFASSCAAHGTIYAVGMPGTSKGSVTLGLFGATVAVKPGKSVKLPAPSGSHTGFGSAVAVSDTFIAAGTASGDVFVFTCVLVIDVSPACVLDSSFPGASASSQGSIHISTSSLFFVNAGAVSVYYRRGSVYQAWGNLTAPPGLSSPTQLAVSGDAALVLYTDTPVMYSRVGTGWAPLRVYQPPGGNASIDGVSLSGATLTLHAVGATMQGVVGVTDSCLGLVYTNGSGMSGCAPRFVPTVSGQGGTSNRVWDIARVGDVVIMSVLRQSSSVSVLAFDRFGGFLANISSSTLPTYGQVLVSNDAHVAIMDRVGSPITICQPAGIVIAPARTRWSAVSCQTVSISGVLAASMALDAAGTSWLLATGPAGSVLLYSCAGGPGCTYTAAGPMPTAPPPGPPFPALGPDALSYAIVSSTKVFTYNTSDRVTWTQTGSYDLTSVLTRTGVRFGLIEYDGVTVAVSDSATAVVVIVDTITGAMYSQNGTNGFGSSLSLEGHTLVVGSGFVLALQSNQPDVTAVPSSITTGLNCMTVLSGPAWGNSPRYVCPSDSGITAATSQYWVSGWNGVLKDGLLTIAAFKVTGGAPPPAPGYFGFMQVQLAESDNRRVVVHDTCSATQGLYANGVAYSCTPDAGGYAVLSLDACGAQSSCQLNDEMGLSDASDAMHAAQQGSILSFDAAGVFVDDIGGPLALNDSLQPLGLAVRSPLSTASHISVGVVGLGVAGAGERFPSTLDFVNETAAGVPHCRIVEVVEGVPVWLGDAAPVLTTTGPSSMMEGGVATVVISLSPTPCVPVALLFFPSATLSLLTTGIVYNGTAISVIVSAPLDGVYAPPGQPVAANLTVTTLSHSKRFSGLTSTVLLPVANTEVPSLVITSSYLPMIAGGASVTTWVSMSILPSASSALSVTVNVSLPASMAGVACLVNSGAGAWTPTASSPWMNLTCFAPASLNASATATANVTILTASVSAYVGLSLGMTITVVPAHTLMFNPSSAVMYFPSFLLVNASCALPPPCPACTWSVTFSLPPTVFVSPYSLTFTASTWNVPVRLNITRLSGFTFTGAPVNVSLPFTTKAQGTTSGGSLDTTLPAASWSFLVVSAPTLTTPTTLPVLDRGGSVAVLVTLSQVPSRSVSLNLQSSNNSAIASSLVLSSPMLSAASLTDVLWLNASQTTTVGVVELVFVSRSDDAAFSGLTLTLTLNVTWTPCAPPQLLSAVVSPSALLLLATFDRATNMPALTLSSAVSADTAAALGSGATFSWQNATTLRVSLSSTSPVITSPHNDTLFALLPGVVAAQGETRSLPACFSNDSVFINDPPLVVPTIRFAQFADDLASIIVAFGNGVMIVVGDNFTTTNCSIVAANANLGYHPQCVMTNATTLSITLGAGWSVQPSFNVTDPCSTAIGIWLLGGVFKSGGGGVGAFLPATCVPILPPARHDPPVPILQVAAVNTICDRIVLNASSTSSPYGALKLTWRVAEADVFSKPYVPMLEAAIAAAGPSAMVVAIPARTFNTSLAFVVTLAATDAIGVIQQVTKTVNISADDGVTIASVNGGQALVASAGAVLPLSAAVTVGSCARGVTYNWVVTFVGRDVNRTQDGYVPPHSSSPLYLQHASSVAIPAGVLVVGAVYVVVLSVNTADGASDSWSASFAVASSGMQAVITGTRGTVWASQAITLSARDSVDGDAVTADPFSYAWMCATGSGGPCVTTNGSEARLVAYTLASGDGIAIPGGTLPVGTYNITLTVSKGIPGARIPHHYRASSASVLINVTSSSVPSLTLLWPTASSVEVLPTAAFVLRTAVASSSPFNVRWYVAPQPVSSPFLTSVERANVTVSAAALMPGSTYTFTANATDTVSGRSAFLSVTVSVRGPPTGGNVTVSPDTGTFLNTTFTAETTGWIVSSASDLPLTYQFAYRRQYDDGSLGALRNIPTSGPSASFILPAGIVSDSSTFLVYAYATNAKGAVGVSGAPALVTVGSLSHTACLSGSCTGSDIDAASVASVQVAVQSVVSSYASQGGVDTFSAGLQAAGDTLNAVATRDACVARDCNGYECVGGTCVCGDGYTGAACDIEPVPVNGSYSDWGPWSACVGACNASTQTRSRTCSPPLYGGTPCDGPATATQSCTLPVCSPYVDGGWSPWSAWGACNASCPGDAVGFFIGARNRSRTCDNPAPTPGRGAPCPGASSEYQQCNMDQCGYAPSLCPGSLAAGVTVHCSGHGSCFRWPVNCSVLSPPCILRCNCDAGFSGDDCSFTSDVGAQIVVLRDRLVTQARALQSNSTAFDFAALLSSALGTTTSVPSLLSSSSLNTLLDGVTSVASASALDEATVGVLLPIVGDLLRVSVIDAVNATASGRRLSSSSVDAATAAAAALAASLAASGVEGESQTVSEPVSTGITVSVQSGPSSTLSLFSLPDSAGLDIYTAITQQVISYNTDPFTTALSTEYVSTGVVSVTVFDSSGNPIALSGLDTPVVIDMSAFESTLASSSSLTASTDGFWCGYYDSGANAWSMQGVALVSFSSQLPVCASVHLTNFVGLSAVPTQLLNFSSPVVTSSYSAIVDASSSPARVSVVVYTTYIALYVLGAAACVLFASRDRAAAARAAVVAPSAPVVKLFPRASSRADASTASSDTLSVFIRAWRSQMAVWHSCVGLLESHAPAIQRWELLLSTVAALGCGGTVAAGMYAVHWPTLTSAQLNLIVPAVAAFASLLVQCVIHASYQGLNFNRRTGRRTLTVVSPRDRESDDDVYSLDDSDPCIVNINDPGGGDVTRRKPLTFQASFMPRKVLTQEPVTLDPQKKLRAGYDVRRPRDERKKTDQPSPHFVENEFFHVVPRSMADGLSGPAPGPDAGLAQEADQKGFPSDSPMSESELLQEPPLVAAPAPRASLPLILPVLSVAFGLLYLVTAIYMCAAVGGSTLEAALAVIGAVVCACGAAALALRCVRPLAAIFTAIALGIAVAGVPLLPQWVTGAAHSELRTGVAVWLSSGLVLLTAGASSLVCDARHNADGPHDIWPGGRVVSPLAKGEEEQWRALRAAVFAAVALFALCVAAVAIAVSLRFGADSSLNQAWGVAVAIATVAHVSVLEPIAFGVVVLCRRARM